MASTDELPAAERARSDRDAALREQTARRRTFAIISHPDAGKTTLSEKLLLYGGALSEAGAVKAKRQRQSATSDWMALERERGISVSSSVLRFEFAGHTLNLLDTPGHRDFSEDTLRVLAAADSAVILLDAARGIQDQTLKLFQVAHERRIPLITFINKYDRPALEPLALIDEIEARLGLEAAPVTWPVGSFEEFIGVIDRRDGMFHRFTRTAGGATIGAESVEPLADARRGDEHGWGRAEDEVVLLDEVGKSFDRDLYLRGESTPIFFGSAVSNFGVRLLLDALVEMAPAPESRPDVTGRPRAVSAAFSGLVFKIQSNVDPRHRDRLASVRICSGEFERGMKLVNARSGRELRANYAHELFGRERQTLDHAYPGDVIGLANAGDLRVGDTVFSGPRVEFPAIALATPDRFVRLTAIDASRQKKLRRGLEQLAHEGVVQVLHQGAGAGPEMILGGAGELQFEVARYRLEHEFGVSVRVQTLDWGISRRVDERDRGVIERWTHGTILTGEDLLLVAFRTIHELDRFEAHNPGVELSPVLGGSGG